MERSGPESRAVENAHPAAFPAGKPLRIKTNFVLIWKEAFLMQKTMSNNKLFKTPFCREYWHLAFAEMKNPRTLVFAALILALRIAVKPLSITIVGELTEGIGFIINAFGSMVYGPVIALMSGAISDTLGFLVRPNGVYFPAYMITEMAGSFVFALFLYRTEITIPRLILCRFCICLFVNVLLAYPIHAMYYNIVLGKEYDLAWIRLVKNIAMFPVETIILVVVFRAVLPPFQKMGYLHSGIDHLDFSSKHIIILISLFVLGAGCVFGYWVIYYNTTSLSKDYTSEERLARNRAIEKYVLEKYPDLNAEEIVCIIDSAYPKVFSSEVTYNVRVYRADVSDAEDPERLMTELEGLSKSKAKNRKELTEIFKETVPIVLTENAREPEKAVKIYEQNNENANP